MKHSTKQAATTGLALVVTAVLSTAVCALAIIGVIAAARWAL